MRRQHLDKKFSLNLNDIFQSHAHFHYCCSLVTEPFVASRAAIKNPLWHHLLQSRNLRGITCCNQEPFSGNLKLFAASLAIKNPLWHHLLQSRTLHGIACCNQEPFAASLNLLQSRTLHGITCFNHQSPYY